MRKFVFYIAFIAIFFTGCTQSGYSQFYSPIIPPQQLEEAIAKKEIIPLKDDQEPRLIKAQDMRVEDNKISSDGYIIIGYSSFNGAYEDIENAKIQAKKLGASIVCVGNSYTNTTQNSGVLVLPDTKTTYSTGNMNMNTNYSNGAYSNTYGNYNGNSTTYGSKLVPYSNTIMRYDQMAGYYMKVDTSNNKLGTFKSKEISREERIKIGSNGIVINYILNNSPAYYSDLLIGDIILAIDNIKIRDYNHFLELLNEMKNFKGTKIISIYRNGELKDIKVNI